MLGQQSRPTYLKAKDGKFYLSTDKELKNSFDNVSGTITDLSFKEGEYQGAPYRSLVITIEDGGEAYKLEVREGSGNYRNMVGFLRNVDLTGRVQINALPQEGKEGKIQTSLTLSDADGKWVKSYFVKDTATALPKVEEILNRAGKHASWDASEQLAILEATVLNDLKPQLGSAPAQSQDDTQSTTSNTEDQPEDNDDSEDDSLPF